MLVQQGSSELPGTHLSIEPTHVCEAYESKNG